MKKVILVDWGVLADIETGLREAWRKKFKSECPLPAVRETNSLKPDSIKEHYEKINSIIYAKGFIEKLNPIEGSLEAIKELARENEVFICTVPLLDYENSVYEKYRWVEKHLGADWTKRLIFIRDKTLLKADILIDDAPVVEGLKKPEWEHVIFDSLYNKHVKGRRMSWRNWREVLKL